jgi:hypothetical protein
MDVHLWHKADVNQVRRGVRYRGLSGHHPEARQRPLATKANMKEAQAMQRTAELLRAGRRDLAILSS